MTQYLTPPALAKLWGVAAEKILLLIRKGELRAVNVAAKTTGRPRWRISPEAVKAFEERRANAQPATPAKKAVKAVRYF